MKKLACVVLFLISATGELYAKPVFTISSDSDGKQIKCVVAREGETELWRARIPDFAEPLPPVRMGERVYVGCLNWIIGLRAESGEIVSYTPLSLNIAALRAAEDVLAADVTLATYDGNYVWHKETVRWRPGTPAPQYFSDGDLRMIRFMKRWSTVLVREARERAGLNSVGINSGDFLKEGIGPVGAHPDVITAEHQKELVEVIPVVEELERRDGVNPWYAFELAKLHFLTGGPDAGTWLGKARERISLSNDALLMSGEAWQMGNAGWSKALYDQGQALRFREGFVPGMITGLTQLIVDMPPGGDTWYAFHQHGLDDAETLLERIYALAPRAEGVAGLYDLMSRKLSEAGNQEAVDTWTARSEEARPYALLGYRQPAWKLLNSTVAVASLLAFLSILGVLIVKHVKRVRLLRKVSPGEGPSETPVRVPSLVKLNPLATAHWYEAVSIVSAGLVLFLSATVLVSTGSTIARTSSLNYAVLSGNPGHIEARRWFERQMDCDAKHLFLGLHHYVRGEYEKALREFELAPGSDIAGNNKAAALAKLGRREEAEAAWKTVGGEGKAAAEFNLTGNPADFWGRLSAEYAPGEPLVCAPTLAEWEHMIGADRIIETHAPLFWRSFFILLREAVPTVFGKIVMMETVKVLLPLVLLGAVLRIFVKPFRCPRADRRGQQRQIDRMPGAVRQWYGLGGLALIAVFTCLLVLFLQLRMPGTLSFMEGHVYTGLTRFFGVEIDLVAAGILWAGVATKCWIVLIALAAIHAGLLFGARKKRKPATPVFP